MVLCCTRVKPEPHTWVTCVILQEKRARLVNGRGGISADYSIVRLPLQLRVRRSQVAMKGTEYPRFNSDPVPKKVQSLYDGRVRQFTDKGGEYHDLNLPQFYDRQRLDTADHVKLDVWSVPDLERPRFKDAMKHATWRHANKGDWFGPSWSTHWFKIELKVPREWKKNTGVYFEWDSSDEGFVFSETGEALQGLTNGSRKEWLVPESWHDGKWHRFYIETSCNELQGDGSPPNNDRYFRLNTADLVLPNLEARALFIDFWIIGDASREFPQDSWQKHLARDILNRIINTFDRENPDESIVKCREIAQEYIGKVDSSDVYKSGKRDLVWAMGNCHIDTAWLWPFGETHRKIGRSWASQIDLINRYPEYKFVASQMQQFKWCKQDYPDLFKKIQKAAKDGRFIPIGGSWVESDTNMPSGDALVRQLLLGQRFTEAHFGFRTRTYWLPDSFGYSPQIPQLCRLAGIDRFLTQKLSWNNINVFPHSTFNWVAIDGSQVLCHMPPANTYTAEAHFGDVKRSLNQHKDLEVHQQGLLLFGNGDGGGGPTPEMLEKLRRCRGLSDTVDLLPRVLLGPSIDDFYDKIVESTHNGKTLATWVGELYLEFHRGTYTTQAAIKRGNRQSEVLMHDVEFVATLASITNSNYKYPTAEIDSLWEDVCLNQFHDVLPGSGIEMIYKDAREIYSRIAVNGAKLLQDALHALGFNSDDGDLYAVNTLPWGRSEVHVDSSGKQRLLLSDVGHPSVSHDVSDLMVRPLVSVSEVRAGTFVLENERLRVTVEGGALTSVWDILEDREVLAKGEKGNVLYLFDDQPLSFPAWDTEQYATESYKIVKPGKAKIVENGPLRGTVEVEQRISDKSKIITKISLDAYVKSRQGSSAPSASYVQFDCTVDWHENYKFLKAEFPVDVHADTAAYETQFGYHRRPTHYNTSWEAAKFEVCGHKWADLSDYSYGVAILNDCKYGYSIHGNRMRLSLLRSPKSPDAHADMGLHNFRYALLPHAGQLDHNVVRAAYNFNHQLHLVRGNPTSGNVFKTFTLTGSPNLVISAIKRFEDDKDVSRGFLPIRGKKDSKSVIIRVYDSLGGKSRGHIVSKRAIAGAWKTNILEDDQEQLDVLSDSDKDKIPIQLRPFEVATYRLELA